MIKPPAPSLLRRRLLSAVPAVLATTIASVAAMRTGPDPEPGRRLAALLGLDPAHLRDRLPRAMQRRLLGVASATRGIPDQTIAASTDADLRKLLRHRILNDYADGRVVDVCGWRLSHTEINCIARSLLCV